MTTFTEYVSKASEGSVFSEEEMAECIGLLMRGDADPAQAATFLTALSRRGETAGEIAGAARALRALAASIRAPAGAVDCCGTGGDGLHTYNISTAVALVCAACGVPVAKHGNRSVTSKSGAADVLESLGVTLALSSGTLEHALRDIGFCFLMAPHHHQAMRHMAPVRKSLGFRTIFNLLGPLANPAGARKQLIGVYDRKWVVPMAEALSALGADSAMVVHGEDGLDEITLTGRTFAAILHPGGRIEEAEFTPDTFGLPVIDLAAIRGGDAAENARALQALLTGERSAYRDMVLANAAAVLYLHDGRSLKDGVAAAASAIDQGHALSILERYKALTS